ncbi:MAG: hypothetical protein ACI9WO_002312 [Sphingobacteriales bacterium]|jgi:hypothetical protein
METFRLQSFSFIIIMVFLGFFSNAQNTNGIIEKYNGVEFSFEPIEGTSIFEYKSAAFTKTQKSLNDELVIITAGDIDFCFFLDKSTKSAELVSRKLNNQANLEAKEFIENNPVPITYPNNLSRENRVNAPGLLTFPISEEYRGKGNSFKVYDRGRNLMTIPIKDQRFISFEAAPLFMFEIEDFNKLTHLIKNENGVLLKKF